MPPSPEQIAAALSPVLREVLGPELRRAWRQLWSQELAVLRQELGAFRDELQCCRREQEQLRQALTAACGDPAETAPIPGIPGITGAATPGASTMAAALARSGPRLNREVWRRLESGASSEHDTDVDLLIDRLHDLALGHDPALGQDLPNGPDPDLGHGDR